MKDDVLRLECVMDEMLWPGARLIEVLRLDIAPPMFEFTDPDGNGLNYLEDRAPQDE